jgi:hypothetical protein
MNNSLSIADRNATILGIMSTILVNSLGLPNTEEMQNLIVTAVMCKLAMWHKEHGKVFDPKNVLLEEDTVAEVFADIHTDILMADIAEQTGIGMEK